MKCPDVAVLLATYNGEKYIGAQLDSLLQQKIDGGGNEQVLNPVCANKETANSEFKSSDTEERPSKGVDYRIYIHDDGSSDNTLSIIRNYVEKYPEKIVQVEGPPTGGAKNNFFFLMREVLYSLDDSNSNKKNADSPRYYFFCDQDDVWLEDKLQTELIALMDLEKEEKQRVPSLVWCDMKVVDERLSVISKSFSDYSNLQPNELDLDRCIMRGKVAGCSMACNKELLSMCCEISDTQDVIMHDWALLLIARIVGRVKYIDRSLALYRQHGDNGIGAEEEGTIKTVASIINRLLSMKQLKATQVNLIRYIAQVASLRQVKEVYQNQQKLIDGAVNFNSMSRGDKVRFVNKYKLYRHPHNKLWASIATFLIN